MQTQTLCPPVADITVEQSRSNASRAKAGQAGGETVSSGTGRAARGGARRRSRAHGQADIARWLPKVKKLPIRQRQVLRIKTEIATGAYYSNGRLSAGLDTLLEDLALLG